MGHSFHFLIAYYVVADGNAFWRIKMKSKLVVTVLMLVLPAMANADRYGHHRGHHGHGGGNWIAPAIIGGAIVGSAIYGATRNDEPDNRYYRRELTQHEIREEQLRQREFELERREREYYDRQTRARDYDNDNCREYYRNDGTSNYYSRNCW